MAVNQNKLFSDLLSFIQRALRAELSADRVSLLDPIANFLHDQLSKDESLNLVFICTENSRRSQISQVWATTAAAYYDIEVNCYSGGSIATAFNPKAVRALGECGFMISRNGDHNPNYFISFSNSYNPIVTYSKSFDEVASKIDQFTAIMTCSHADENCPVIHGANGRFPLQYEDPKEFDNTLKEGEAYANTCLMIACEMLYLFRKIAKKRRGNHS